MARSDADLLVIGGGPAGSTVANLVARAGHRVLVIEKERMPRFCIGESLLSSEAPLYPRLGFQPTAATYVPKQGANIIDERCGEEAIFLFTEALPGTPPGAWQVERARFDRELLELAATAGADVHQGERTLAVEPDEDHVRVGSDRGSYTARYVIDATGRDAFLARRRRTVAPIKGFGVAAAFFHYSGVRDDVCRELEQTGNLRVLIRDEGWGWVIPLRGAMLSIGLVGKKPGDFGAMLAAMCESSPLVRRLTAGASKRTDVQLVGNYAFANRAPCGPRYCAIGDAAAFLDPVFSTGVSLAMTGAMRVADALAPALADGSEGRPDLMAGPHAEMKHAYECYGSLVHSFYNTALVRTVFFSRDQEPAIRAGLITMLAGCVFRQDNRFQEMLLRSRRRFRMPQ